MYFYFMIKYWQMEIKKLSFLKFHAGPFLKHPAKKIIYIFFVLYPICCRNSRQNFLNTYSLFDNFYDKKVKKTSRAGTWEVICRFTLIKGIRQKKY
ncbi:hypothetical protein CAY57_02105 [Heyndrickxia coagulans]|nr:hypothetical protein CAY57_02105 [Heyndrickxia coagulans]